MTFLFCFPVEQVFQQGGYGHKTLLFGLLADQSEYAAVFQALDVLLGKVECHY